MRGNFGKCKGIAPAFADKVVTRLDNHTYQSPSKLKQVGDMTKPNLQLYRENATMVRGKPVLHIKLEKYITTEKL